MEINLKKFASILGIVCLGMTKIAADQSYSSTDANMPEKMPEEGTSVFVSADYTLWTAREEGLAYAISGYYNPATSSPSTGQVYYPQWKLRSGFKVAIGAYLSHDNWDLQAQYTWFYNQPNSLQNAGFNAFQGVNIFPIGESSTTLESVYSSSAKWNIWFNRIDAQLGKTYFPPTAHYTSLRPFLGFLGAWDKQHFNVQYQLLKSDANPYIITTSQSWWGVGPYSGVWSTYTFVSDSANEWSLFINGGTALLWSRGLGNSQQTDNTASKNTIFQYTNSFYNVDPMFEVTLGLRWQAYWDNGNWGFMLQAGWEEQVYLGHLVHETETHTLTLQGLTIEAKLSF